MTFLLNAALAYAELGYRVFPCNNGPEPVPLTARGFHDATGDGDQIDQWWQRYPNACIGLATEGLLVVDIDGPDNPWLSDEPERSLSLTIAPTSLTPGGGRHHIFRRPEGKSWTCTVGRLAPHVDTRTDGGYIVVPPSRRQDGIYRWLEGCELDVPADQLPLPPEWLVELLDALDAPADATGLSVSNIIPQGHRNVTLARLAGAMRRVGMSEDEIRVAIVQANRDRCRPPLPDRAVARIARSIARYRPDEVAVALAENHWEQMYAEEEEDSDAVCDPGPIPEGLLRVPGFIDRVIDFTLDTAPYPEPVLAFCGALVLQAVLAGRKVRDPADNRTTLYVLGLANSGAGKDHPRKVNQRVLIEAGMAHCLGDTFASGEGIEDRLFGNPTVLFQTDEIDGLMVKINQARDGRHENIMNVLLKMYTSASAAYPMRVKAGREPGVIDQPCLCIFGTAIPKHYYEALSVKMLTNGFFARMLILESGRRSRGQEGTVRELPPAIVETARWWADFRPGHGNLKQWHPVPVVVPYTPEAAEVLDALRARADDQYAAAEERDDPVGMAIWARANEKARRLALVYACSRNHREPTIGQDAAEWASEFVDYQTRRMLFMAAEHVSENEFDAKCKALVSTLRRWRDRQGDAWMPFWKISRKHPWSERDHDEVRTALLNQRLIEYEERNTSGRPQRLYRLA